MGTLAWKPRISQVVSSNSHYLRIGTCYDPETLPKVAQLNLVKSHKRTVAYRQHKKLYKKFSFGGAILPPPTRIRAWNFYQLLLLILDIAYTKCPRFEILEKSNAALFHEIFHRKKILG